MTFEPYNVSYELTRRPRLVAHVRSWTRHGPWLAAFIILPVVAVLYLAQRFTPWFLLLLFLPLPPFTDVQRLIGGFVWAKTPEGRRVIAERTRKELDQLREKGST